MQVIPHSIPIRVGGESAKELVRRLLNERHKLQVLVRAHQWRTHAAHCSERVVVWLKDHRLTPAAPSATLHQNHTTTSGRGLDIHASHCHDGAVRVGGAALDEKVFAGLWGV